MCRPGGISFSEKHPVQVGVMCQYGLHIYVGAGAHAHGYQGKRW